MARGFTQLAYSTILPEQILAYFGIDINDNNMCVCPFHKETVPSMQVNQDYVYCYGCKWSGDVWRLSEELLQFSTIPTYVGTWLRTTNFSSPTGRIYSKEGYTGSVNNSLIEYWHNCLVDRPELILALQQERMFTLDTIHTFQLGYRPDKDAWVIPFMYNNESDIVQFRSRKDNDAGKKYWGLKGHQRGCIINRNILDTSQDYVVVLMGALDPLLAAQDGLPAVGMNGSMPFKKTDKQRVQDMFSKQNIIFIVPDNNPVEVKEAHKLAGWINGDVRCFPEELPHNTDYIDYRKMGKTPEDFKRDVLGVLPYDDVYSDQIFSLICSLYDVGDKYSFAEVYLDILARGISFSDVAIVMANQHLKTSHEKRSMYNVKCKEDFIRSMRYNYIIKGGW